MAPSPAAGKTGQAPKTPTKLARKPQSAAGNTQKPETPKAPSGDDVKDKTENTSKAPSGDDVKDKAQDTAQDTKDQAQSKVEMKDESEAGDQLEEREPKPEEEEDATAGAQETVSEAGDDVNTPADTATEKAGDTADEAEDEAEETPKAAKKTAEKDTDDAKSLPKKGVDAAGKGAKQAADTTKDTAKDTKDGVEDAADDAKQTADDAAEGVKEQGEDVEDETEDHVESTKETAQDAKNTAEDTAGDAQDTAQDTAEDAAQSTKDKADDATDKAEDTAEDATEEATDKTEDATDKATDKTQDVTDKADSTTEDATDKTEDATEDATEKAEDATEKPEEAADGVKDTAEDATEDAEDAEDAAPKVDMSILKGLEVDKSGDIIKDGKKVGKLVEGDAEDLEGYPIGDDGEILDDDGDLVGRCELTREVEEELKKQAEEAADDEDESKDPALKLLKGLTCDPTGNILNEDGDTIGQLIEGDPMEIQGKEFNENGEILDDDGNVIARAKIHEDAPEEIIEETREQAKKEADEATEAPDKAEEGVEETKEEVEENVDEVAGKAEEELPGVEALEGKELNDEGEIVDEEGNVLGKLAEGNADDVKGLTVNDKGEVVDSEGNVVGKVELAEGAAEKLKDTVALDLRILDGLKVNKKGKVLDEEGEEIGKLVEGEAKDCAGKKINDHGEVLNDKGDVVGKVEIIPGEAAEEATRALKDKLKDQEPKEPEIKEIYPELATLDGLKVNKKGQILNEDGEPIGELVEGEAKDCAGKKVNDKGEVLDDKGNVIGKVKTLAQEVEVSPEEAEEGDEEVGDEEGAEADGVPEEAVDEAREEGQEEGHEEGKEEGQEEGKEQAEEEQQDGEEDSGPELPPLSVLEGLKVNKAGKLIDGNGTIVGELVEGDAKKLSKLGITCDDQGQFWDTKGHVIGKAQTVANEDPDEESPFAGLEGLIVAKDGWVKDENDNIVGKIVEGDHKKLVGRAVDEDGDILDKKGSVVGHAERYEESDPEAEPEAQPEDLSILAGKTVNKAGNVIGDEGVPIGRLVEGNPKELAGKKIDKDGQIWNDEGKVVGRCELIPEKERESKAEGPFAGHQGLRVVADGKVADEDENIVGEIVEGNAKRLIGLAVDEDGDIIDRHGNVKGHAEPLEDEPEQAPVDTSILDGLTLTKQGFLVGQDGTPVGRLVEGNVKELAGRKSDGEGQIHNDTGKVVGRCEVIPENERGYRSEGPFAGLEGLKVIPGGKVEDGDGNVVGVLTEGDPKRLVGHTVDEDGDIVDKYGNKKGHAEPYDEPDEKPEDLSVLAGCTVNKAGNIVDANGAVVGRVAEGDPSTMIGKKVDGKGQIWDNEGNVIGKAAIVHGADNKAEGPFAGFDSITVAKEGLVVTPDGSIVGRVIEGDAKKLVGHKVDEDGEISDKNGNTIGKAERWEPEEKERRVNPMSGRRVNKRGEVCDENGDVMGRLTAGDLGHCVGLEIDDNGYVVDNDGNKVGEVTLNENITEEEPEPEEMTEEEMQKKQDAEIADKMANICQQTLERVQPVLKQITEHVEKADRTPKEELDEEELVNNVKPLIEEGGRILQECNGSLRGLDPDGHIAAQAKGRAGTKEATPEEYRLADCLKELTTNVVTTIDNAKKKISDMPHAKKKLNPLWGLLTQPLFQIIAAVGLLLTGVLGLVGQLLNGLGLGGLVNGLLGGLGINKLLKGIGLGSIGESLGGGKKKKSGGGGGASSLPVVGGLFGGK